MGLLIQPTQDKKIHIKGTEIELNQVYIRLEFGCRPNGQDVEISFYTYANKSAYQTGNYLPTDLPVGNISKSIDLATQTQSVQTVHDLTKIYFEELGYQVTIDL